MSAFHPLQTIDSGPKPTLRAASNAIKIIKVRHVFLLAVSAAFLSAATKSETLHYALRFGATPTSPIGPPVPCAAPTPGHTLCPYLEPDYVPNYETAVPHAIQSCGALFVRFEPLTEGAERAFFQVDTDRASKVVACIKQHVPQANVEAAAQAPRP